MYSVKEVYYTLQCEGNQSGTPSVFLRFSGCNLWNGRESGRSSAICKFCDTDFVGTDGENGGRFDSEVALADKVEEVWLNGVSVADVNRNVVCTGGEPLLQLDSGLVSELRDRGFTVSVETNGTMFPPVSGVDWLCVSPKAGAGLVLSGGNEIKLVFPQNGAMPENFEHLDFDYFYLQPMDGPELERNTSMAVEYCMSNPRWRLSTQIHKQIGLR